MFTQRLQLETQVIFEQVAPEYPVAQLLHASADKQILQFAIEVHAILVQVEPVYPIAQVLHAVDDEQVIQFPIVHSTGAQLLPE